jgi:uncharacterized protein YxjI
LVAGFLRAIVKKALFTLFQYRFSVDEPVPDDLEATGDLFDHEYGFTWGGKTVATVSKRWFSWTDSCGVDIAEDEDDIISSRPRSSSTWPATATTRGTTSEEPEPV